MYSQLFNDLFFSALKSYFAAKMADEVSKHVQPLPEIKNFKNIPTLCQANYVRRGYENTETLSTKQQPSY